MLKIRLTRRGKKNNAFFRVVVAEHTAPIKGRFKEVLGFLNPHTKERSFNEEKIKYWIEKGAQCSDSVHNLFVANGIIKGPKKAVKMKPAPPKDAEGEKQEKSEEKKPEGESKSEEVKKEETKKDEPKMDEKKTE